MKEINIVGKAYRELKTLVKKYAQADYPVLFAGETGSGKELFAQLYMKSSERSKRQERSVNCAAFSDELLQSEVLGHKKGAFTGAHMDRKGLIKTCNDGILFLDELAEASPQFQALILRVSEQNSFKKLGSDDEEKCNTLIIAATNNLGRLRDDLKQRFHILPVPPLQISDIPVLAKHFLGKPLKPTVLRELMNRDYIGNVRELKRHCESLKAERGNGIFTEKEKSYLFCASRFDYPRYRRELEIWDKYLQPLINEYGPRDLKYKYMDWNPHWIDFQSKDRDLGKLLAWENLFPDDGKKGTHYVYGTLELIEWLRMRPEREDELLPLDDLIANPRKLEKQDPDWLNSRLKAARTQLEDIEAQERDLHMRLEQTSSRSRAPELSTIKQQLQEVRNKKGEFEYWIEYLESFNRGEEQAARPISTVKRRAEISLADLKLNFRVHMREYFAKGLLPYLLEQLEQIFGTSDYRSETIEKPDLSYLLEITPSKDANKEFNRIYVTYHLRKHSDNKQKTAESLGLSKKGLDSKIRSLPGD